MSNKQNDELNEYVFENSLAAKQLGSRGGKATSKKYGKEHYQKLAANMNKKRWGKSTKNRKDTEG